MLKRLLVCIGLVFLSAIPAIAQTTSTLTFTASVDHAVVAQGVPVVASYELVLTPQGGQPLAPHGLSKPQPNAQNVITQNVTTYLNSLPAGTYTAVVRAVGPGGAGVSPVSPSFTLVVPVPAAPTVPVITRGGS